MPENPTLSEWTSLAATTPGSILLHNAQTHDTRLFTNPTQILTAHTLEEIPTLFPAIESALDHGSHVAGYLTYEAGYHFEPTALESTTLPTQPLAWFGIYPNPLHEQLPTPPPTHQTPAPTLTLDQTEAQYTTKIETIRQLIAAGDLYQANFTVNASFPWPHTPAALFAAMLQTQPVPYAALLHPDQQTHILSASPELFFRKQGDKITVSPMKGTAPRGRDIHEDAQQSAWLSSDPKNRAENVMIVDLMRSDLGRICLPGTISVSDLFAIHSYPTLLQMTSTISGRLNPATTLYQIFRSLFPCGSITGAPKVRTMQILRYLEDAPRGASMGAIGYFTPTREATFSVAIRTLTLRHQQAQLRIGSGITHSSSPQAEYAETLLKSKFLQNPTPPFSLIETLAWTNHYHLLDYHLDRLEASAKYFNIPINRREIQALLTHHATTLPAPHRVRLLLSQAGEATITSTPLTPSPTPALLEIAPTRLNPNDPFLRHKTTNRATYDQALKQAQAKGCTDAIFLNTQGEVTECAIHNLMIRHNDHWLTPPLSSGILPGVYRRHLLATHPEIKEAPIPLEALEASKRILIFNSVRGLRRAKLHPSVRTEALSS